MEHLLGPTQTLIIAAVLLVVVASLPAVAAPAARKLQWSVLVYVVALLATVALVWEAFDHGRVMTDIFPSKIARYAVQELRDANEPNVILIDGGSYVQNGVDADLVSKQLKKLGYSARVVRLAVGAANHFERYRMQQAIVQRLTGKHRSDQRWIYLGEVQAGYDRMPLAQFDSNQDTDRSIQYLTIANSWQAARAVRSPGVDELLDGAWRWPLFRHAMVNAFSAGAAQRFVAEDTLEIGGGNVAEKRPGRFKFRGLQSQIELSKTPAVPADVKLPWLTDIRDARTHELWRPLVSHFMYFGLPSTSVDQLKHIRNFCASTHTGCISPSDEQLLSDLDDRKLWHDPSHMTRQGAEIYSRWLAREIVGLGVLRK